MTNVSIYLSMASSIFHSKSGWLNHRGNNCILMKASGSKSVILNSEFPTIARKMTSQEAPGLGNLVRLLPISLKDIPSHSAFEQSVSTDINNKDHNPNPSSDKTFQSSPNPLARREGHPSLIEFIKAILTEATVFIDNILPRTFTEGSEKSSPPSAAKVRLLKRMISPSELRQVPWSSSKIPRNADQTVLQNMEEAWFARRSHHVNLKRSGTADIAEIDDGLMVDHSEHEKEYTPDVFDSYKVVDWDKEIQQSGEIPGYSRVGMNSMTSSSRACTLILMPWS